MSAKPIISAATLAGILVPVAIVITFSLLWHAGLRPSPHLNSILFKLKIMIWPSSYPFSILTEDVVWNSFTYWVLLVLAVVANAVLYSAIGLLLWLGANRFGPLMVLTGLGIAAYWVFVLTA
jgi:hypothetical protein